MCYAEKTHGKDVLPYLCAAKSPQAVAGTLVKGLFCHQHNLHPHQIYHMAVMPCFDKKLEAVREELVVSSNGAAVASTGAGAAGNSNTGAVQETDCVLTTSELQDLLKDRGETLAEQPVADMDPWVTDGTRGSFGGWRGVRGGSGGFLEYSLKAAAREIYHVVRCCPFSGS